VTPSWRGLEFDVAQQRGEQRLRMPEDGQAASMPIIFAIASARHPGGALADVQPPFELAQDFLDATGQGHQLLILVRAVKRFHPAPSYTRAVLSDVFGGPVQRACCQAIQPATARV
jgi:hypothetical protein